ELAWRRTAGALTFGVNAFHNHVEGYTWARTLDQFEDFRLIKYAQRDANFQGGEDEATLSFARAFSATLFGDLVRAQFDGDENLPRIPAPRYGTRRPAGFGEFEAQVELDRMDRQRRIAEFESVTPGHTMLDFTLRQRLAGAGLNWYLRGSNLLDEQVWNHSSFLADVVPLPRR